MSFWHCVIVSFILLSVLNKDFSSAQFQVEIIFWDKTEKTLPTGSCNKKECYLPVPAIWRFY